MLRKAKGDQAVINPSVFRLRFRPVARTILLIFDQSQLEQYAGRLGYHPDKRRKMVHQVYYPPPHRDMPGLAGPAVSAPTAAYFLEMLIALGARRIVGFGFAGSIQQDLSIGETFVPVQAHSEEGTSPLYFPGETIFETAEPLREEIEQYLLGRNAAYRFGPIWTTDAIFRETADKVIAYGSKGVMAVDMESSALCAVARYRNVQYAALMVISDELASLRWNPGFKRPVLKKALDKAFDLLGGLRFSSG